MTKLKDAMLEKMAHIVLSENRSFSYHDLMNVRVDGVEHTVAYGTYRNIICELKKEGEIELDCRSSLAFYTLKDCRFGKAVTSNHTVVHNNALYKMLHEQPLDRQSIHNIRLKLKIPNISKILSLNPEFHRNKRSNDIMIPAWDKENAIVKIVVHQTDLVSVIIGCSLKPIRLDVKGIIRFFNLLVWIEAKIETILGTGSAPYGKDLLIPNYKKWIITMWHIGSDSLIEYTGEKFSITVEDAEHILTRLYVKDFNGKKRIRKERQEYPNKPVQEAVNETTGIFG